MTSVRPKRRQFLSLVFIIKSISKKLLIKMFTFFSIFSICVHSNSIFIIVEMGLLNISVLLQAKRRLIIQRYLEFPKDNGVDKNLKR